MRSPSFCRNTWNAKTSGVPFDQKQYIERARRYMENVIEHPDLMRGLRTP
jgi:hypothetical protein